MSWFLDVPVQRPPAHVHDNIWQRSVVHDAGDFQTGCVWLYVCFSFQGPKFSAAHSEFCVVRWNFLICFKLLCHKYPITQSISS